MSEHGIEVVSIRGPVPDLAEEALADQLDDPVPSYGYDLLPMVGLGGSAGSIQALQEFFRHMPPDAGMAFVVVLHLAPDRESTLAELLQKSTAMPVLQVIDEAQVEANHVYVIPPGKSLKSARGHLRLHELDGERERGKRTAIDLFFRTLADTHGPHASAVVLSGADGDGTIGIKRIKERGGLTVAQDPEEAEHSSMPRSAVATGMVDWVLPVSAMPQRLLAYYAQEHRLKLPPEDGPQPASHPPRDAGGDEAALREVLAFLRTRSGHDFSYYKRATILRRIARRMQVNGTDDMPAYLAFLRTHAGESGALLQDLLISVTNFFRDRDAFDIVEANIARLFEGKGPGDAVRVWVTACATGEEAYSVAMLLQEYAGMLDQPPQLQVFATDLDENAIRTARAGIFPAAITADVSEDRLRRFFVQEHRGWRVKSGLREIVLFAVHDLLKDASFSRLDLVTCRNLLIYLNRDAQARAFDIFHFALRLDGLLFLGSSEAVDEGNPVFSVLDKKHRLYSHRQGPRVSQNLPHGPGTLARAVDKLPKIGPTLPRELLVPPAFAEPQRTDSNAAVLARLHYQLVEMLAPPSVVVDANNEIVHLSEGVGRFLQFAGGAPSGDLLHVVHPMLRVELRAALFRAAQTDAPVEVYDLPIEEGGSASLVNLKIQPAATVQPGHMLVVFDKHGASPEVAARVPGDADPAARDLDRALQQMKTHLRDTVEQYEASTEELKASNEELQAMNEELRSASEELETGREEAQSTNEELSTVNQELKSKVDELWHANSDLHNLMGASAIATVFLDRELRITRYTSTAVPLFNLIPGDLGRPLTDLSHRLDYPDLRHDAAQVLAQLVPTEREVRDGGGHWYLARALPYRTLDDHIAGVVLTFVDVTEQRRSAEAHRGSQEALRLSDERLRLVVENARDYAIVSTDLDRNVCTWNSGAEVLLGHSEAEILGRPLDAIFVPEDRAAGVPVLEAQTALKEGRASDDRMHLRKDGSRFFASGVLMPMRDAAGEALGFVKILRDQTQAQGIQAALEQSRKALVDALADNEAARAELLAASAAKDHFLAVLSHELRTPLTPVVVALQLLARRNDLAESVRSTLDMIRRNVRIEAHMIDDLLDLTRMSRGSFDVARQSMDLHAAIRGAVEICEPDLQGRKQRLEVDLHATDHHLQGDDHRLQQAVWNLLKNASKFTPVGGVIGLATESDGRRVRIVVTDSGIGIEAEVLPTIFNAFHQGSAAIAQEFGGLGLGLAIANATVKAHGGEIRAESPGRGLGAVFTIELPLSDSADPIAEPAGSSPSAGLPR